MDVDPPPPPHPHPTPSGLKEWAPEGLKKIVRPEGPAKKILRLT